MRKCCYMYILHSLRPLISPGGPLGGGPPWLGPPWLGPHCCCGEWAGPENRPLPGGPGGPRSARGSLGPPPPNRWSGGGPLGSLGWSLGSPNGPRLSSVGNKTKWLFHKKYACLTHDIISTCTTQNQGREMHIRYLSCGGNKVVYESFILNLLILIKMLFSLFF